MRAFTAFILITVLAFPAFAAEKESAYDRVMKTQTIRCGYGTSKPWIYKDAADGEMKGFYVDVMNEVAAELGFKLVWPEETGWGNLPESLKNGRVDVACSTMWLDPIRGKQAAFTRPLFYTPLYAYSRAGDPRFSGRVTMDFLNNPDIRIVVLEGDISNNVAMRLFPRAKLIVLPGLASVAEYLMNVTMGKADVAVLDSISVSDFNKSQEKKLKKIALLRPISISGNALAVGIHDLELREVLNTAIQHLLDSGKMKDMVDKFEQEYPDSLVMPAGTYGDE